MLLFVQFGVTERFGKHHVVAHKYRLSFYKINKVVKCNDIGGSLFGFDFSPFKYVLLLMMSLMKSFHVELLITR